MLVALVCSTCSIIGVGVVMPTMDWGYFLDAHYRPHLVVVTLGTSSNSTSGRHLVPLLERLTESLGTAGNYAIRREGRVVKVAFERDLDAETFGQALMAKGAERGPEWASQSVCSFDRDAQRKMVATLKESRLKFAKRPEWLRGDHQRERPHGVTAPVRRFPR